VRPTLEPGDPGTGARVHVRRGLVVALILAQSALASARPRTTSPDAVLLRFEFDGELVTSRRSSPDRQVRAQLLYLIGLANGLPGGARLDHLSLTNVILDPLPGGRHRIRYHARVPIAWGAGKRWPESFDLPLPRQIDERAQEAFVRRYGRSCIDAEDAGHRGPWGEGRGARARTAHRGA